MTNSKKTPQEAEPYVDGRAFEQNPDWEYYARRVASTLGRATEEFGWDEKSLLAGQVQESLFSDKFTDKKDQGERKASPKVSQGEKSLEDFM